MNWRKFPMLLCVLSLLATIPWGVDQGWAQPQNGNAGQNQLNQDQNATAALRKSKGLRRNTTMDERKAAAKRNAARKAAAHQKVKGGANP
jgi:hypothetical protein